MKRSVSINMTFSDALDNIAHFIHSIQQKEATFCHRVPLSHRLREGKGGGDGNGKGGKSRESFIILFLNQLYINGRCTQI